MRSLRFRHGALHYLVVRESELGIGLRPTRTLRPKRTKERYAYARISQEISYPGTYVNTHAQKKSIHTHIYIYVYIYIYINTMGEASSLRCSVPFRRMRGAALASPIVRLLQITLYGTMWHTRPLCGSCRSPPRMRVLPLPERFF